jgi:hypothetical protein
MTDLAKTLMLVGAVIFGLGVVLALTGKVPGIGKLPGDILIKKENFSFYFPLATCIILSIILTLMMQVFNRR